jgi:hypothetical protein
MYLPPFLRPVSKRYPRAFAAFMKWAKGRGMDEFIEEYPLEMIYGMLLIFFEDNGFRVATNITPIGRSKISIYRQNLSGRWRNARDAVHFRSTTRDTYNDAMVLGFSEVEKRIIQDAPPAAGTIVIGVDMRKKLIASRSRVKEP